jgi:dipeptide/tripeptide permease
VARELFILFFCATIAFLLGNGYYKSFGSGVLTIKGHAYKGRTYRRDKEPISYWIGIAIGTFAFLVMVSGTAVMAFLICVGLSGNSK